MVSAGGQICFLLVALAIGARGASAWWLIPLTLAMAVFGWLTDRWWKIRFYDVYSFRDWARFWLQTLFGITCFVVAAFIIGRFVGHYLGAR